MAIKAIVNIDLELHRQFINEVDVIMRLDHPNITKIIDMWQWDKLIFLVIEFHEGGQLGACLAKRGYFEEYEVYKLMQQMTSVLIYLKDK